MADELYSERLKRQLGQLPDTYSYDEMSPKLRTQIVHIMHDAIGVPSLTPFRDNSQSVYAQIVKALRHAHGRYGLLGGDPRDDHDELVAFLMREPDVLLVLDAVELIGIYIIAVASRFGHMHRDDASDIAKSAIDELNHRFMQNGFGYRFEGHQIIRVDSQFLHSEVVKPALALLQDRDFAGSEQEFHDAHEHYRLGRYEESLVDCLKSLESTIKVICDRQGWTVSANATCKNLIDICFEKELVPKFWVGHFGAIRAILDGVPTARNKVAGHGQGVSLRDVPGHLVAYVLHMTAAAIVFLVEAEKDL